MDKCHKQLSWLRKLLWFMPERLSKPQGCGRPFEFLLFFSFTSELQVKVGKCHPYCLSVWTWKCFSQEEKTLMLHLPWSTGVCNPFIPSSLDHQQYACTLIIHFIFLMLFHLLPAIVGLSALFLTLINQLHFCYLQVIWGSFPAL